MTHLQTSAAYVRKNVFPDRQTLRAAGLRDSEVEAVLELLETPHTVDSLQRAVNRDTDADRRRIEDVMKRLLDADLIELSPDS